MSIDEIRKMVDSFTDYNVSPSNANFLARSILLGILNHIELLEEDVRGIKEKPVIYEDEASNIDYKAIRDSLEFEPTPYQKRFLEEMIKQQGSKQDKCPVDHEALREGLPFRTPIVKDSFTNAMGEMVICYQHLPANFCPQCGIKLGKEGK